MPSETERLSAHIIALETVLSEVCREISLASPDNDFALRKAFSEAARKVDDAIAVLGERPDAEMAIEASRIVKDMNTKVFSRPRK